MEELFTRRIKSRLPAPRIMSNKLLGSKGSAKLNVQPVAFSNAETSSNTKVPAANQSKIPPPKVLYDKRLMGQNIQIDDLSPDGAVSGKKSACNFAVNSGFIALNGIDATTKSVAQCSPQNSGASDLRWSASDDAIRDLDGGKDAEHSACQQEQLTVLNTTFNMCDHVCHRELNSTFLAWKPESENKLNLTYSTDNLGTEKRLNSTYTGDAVKNQQGSIATLEGKLEAVGKSMDCPTCSKGLNHDEFNAAELTQVTDNNDQGLKNSTFAVEKVTGVKLEGNETFSLDIAACLKALNVHETIEECEEDPPSLELDDSLGILTPNQMKDFTVCIDQQKIFIDLNAITLPKTTSCDDINDIPESEEVEDLTTELQESIKDITFIEAQHVSNQTDNRHMSLVDFPAEGFKISENEVSGTSLGMPSSELFMKGLKSGHDNTSTPLGGQVDSPIGNWKSRLDSPVSQNTPVSHIIDYTHTELSQGQISKTAYRENVSKEICGRRLVSLWNEEPPSCSLDFDISLFPETMVKPGCPKKPELYNTQSALSEGSASVIEKPVEKCLNCDTLPVSDKNSPFTIVKAATNALDTSLGFPHDWTPFLPVDEKLACPVNFNLSHCAIEQAVLPHENTAEASGNTLSGTALSCTVIEVNHGSLNPNLQQNEFATCFSDPTVIEDKDDDVFKHKTLENLKVTGFVEGRKESSLSLENPEGLPMDKSLTDKEMEKLMKSSMESSSSKDRPVSTCTIGSTDTGYQGDGEFDLHSEAAGSPCEDDVRGHQFAAYIQSGSTLSTEGLKHAKLDSVSDSDFFTDTGGPISTESEVEMDSNIKPEVDLDLPNKSIMQTCIRKTEDEDKTVQNLHSTEMSDRHINAELDAGHDTKTEFPLSNEVGSVEDAVKLCVNDQTLIFCEETIHTHDLASPGSENSKILNSTVVFPSVELPDLSSCKPKANVQSKCLTSSNSLSNSLLTKCDTSNKVENNASRKTTGKNVVPKIKEMETVGKSQGNNDKLEVQAKRIAPTPRKSKWDAVTSKIAAGLAEERNKPKTKKEVRSKVDTNLLGARQLTSKKISQQDVPKSSSMDNEENTISRSQTPTSGREGKNNTDSKWARPSTGSSFNTEIMESPTISMQVDISDKVSLDKSATEKSSALFQHISGSIGSFRSQSSLAASEKSDRSSASETSTSQADSKIPRLALHQIKLQKSNGTLAFLPVQAKTAAGCRRPGAKSPAQMPQPQVRRVQSRRAEVPERVPSGKMQQNTKPTSRGLQGHLTAASAAASKKNVPAVCPPKLSPASQANKLHPKGKDQTTKAMRMTLSASRSIHDQKSPVLATRAEYVKETQRLGALCEARTKELNLLKMQLKHATMGVDAFAAVISYLTEELNAFSHPCMVAEIKKCREDLKEAQGQIKICQQQLEEVQQNHAYEIATLTERLSQAHQEEMQQLQDANNTNVEELQCQHATELEWMAERYARITEHEEERHKATSMEIDKQHKKEKDELVELHALQLEEANSSHKEACAALAQQLTELQEQCNQLSQQAQKFEEMVLKDTDSKLQWLSGKKQDLDKEVDSLKAVLEMKQTEIHALRKDNMEMKKELEELPLAREKIKLLQARAEDLKAMVSEKVQVERKLTSEHLQLKDWYEKESKVNKRLSMEKEELQWKLKQNMETSFILNSLSANPDVLEKLLGENSPLKSPLGLPKVADSVEKGSQGQPEISESLRPYNTNRTVYRYSPLASPSKDASGGNFPNSTSPILSPLTNGKKVGKHEDLPKPRCTAKKSPDRRPHTSPRHQKCFCSAAASKRTEFEAVSEEIMPCNAQVQIISDPYVEIPVRKRQGQQQHDRPQNLAVPCEKTHPSSVLSKYQDPDTTTQGISGHHHTSFDNSIHQEQGGSVQIDKNSGSASESVNIDNRGENSFSYASGIEKLSGKPKTGKSSKHCRTREYERHSSFIAPYMESSDESMDLGSSATEEMADLKPPKETSVTCHTEQDSDFSIPPSSDPLDHDSHFSIGLERFMESLQSNFIPSDKGMWPSCVTNATGDVGNEDMMSSKSSGEHVLSYSSNSSSAGALLEPNPLEDAEVIFGEPLEDTSSSDGSYKCKYYQQQSPREIAIHCEGSSSPRIHAGEAMIQEESPPSVSQLSSEDSSLFKYRNRSVGASVYMGVPNSTAAASNTEEDGYSVCKDLITTGRLHHSSRGTSFSDSANVSGCEEDIPSESEV